jgi:mycoredoxin
MDDPVTMYSTPWCGYCRRLKRQMAEAGIPYREVDIEAEAHFGERIERVTGGFRTVPTLEVGGRLLVNPTIVEVEHALTA